MDSAKHIMVSNLRASDIPSPFEPKAAEIKIVREQDLEGFMVAKAHDSKGGFYYTIRNANFWDGYKITRSIIHVREIIKKAS